MQFVNAPSLDALIDEAIPADIRQTEPLNFGRALSEPELLTKDAWNRFAQPGDGFFDRPRLLRHAPTARYSAQCAGKSRLVHRLPAIPGRDQSRPS
jgi:hypothetical protein